MRRRKNPYAFIDFVNDKRDAALLCAEWKTLFNDSVPREDKDIDFMFDCIGPDGVLDIPDPNRVPVLISSLRSSIQNILENIINGGPLLESEDVKVVTEMQARYVNKYEVFNNRFVEKTVMLRDDLWKFFAIPSPLMYACQTLFDYMGNGDFNKLKKCPYCRLFFIAKDAKRKICYESSCLKEYKRLHKKYQREVNPVKYM